MRRPAKFRRMRPMSGGRLRVYTASAPQLYKLVDQTAARFNCSKNLVVNTALSEFFGFPEERFDKAPK